MNLVAPDDRSESVGLAEIVRCRPSEDEPATASRVVGEANSEPLLHLRLVEAERRLLLEWIGPQNVAQRAVVRRLRVPEQRTQVVDAGEGRAQAAVDAEESALGRRLDSGGDGKLVENFHERDVNVFVVLGEAFAFEVEVSRQEATFWNAGE